MNTVTKAITAASVLKASQQVRDLMDKQQEAGIKAFRCGQQAKRLGLFRVSPYYQKPELDACFFAGFDQK